MVIKDGSKLKSDLYTNETNTHQFFMPNLIRVYTRIKSLYHTDRQ